MLRTLLELLRRERLWRSIRREARRERRLRHYSACDCYSCEYVREHSLGDA